jgi:hypothetical protein
VENSRDKSHVQKKFVKNFIGKRDTGVLDASFLELNELFRRIGAQ